MKEKKKGGLLKKIAIGFIALVVLGAVFGSKEDTPSPSTSTSSTANTQTATSQIESTEPEITYIQISATDLLDAYDANGVAADELYKGQLVEITGTIGSIDKDVFDTAYITLENSNNKYSILSVQCYFDDDHLSQLASLSVGDTITIRGVCDGHSLNVMVKKCELV